MITINKDSNEKTSSESRHQCTKELQSLNQELEAFSIILDRLSEEIAMDLAKLDKILKNKSRKRE